MTCSLSDYKHTVSLKSYRSGIHSFCLDAITKVNVWRVKKYGENPPYESKHFNMAIRYTLRYNELTRWCRNKNLDVRVTFSMDTMIYSFHFKKPKDAMLFKLKWHT